MNIPVSKHYQVNLGNSHFQINKVINFGIGSGVALAAYSCFYPTTVKSIFDYAISCSPIYNTLVIASEVIALTSILALSLMKYMDFSANNAIRLGAILSGFTLLSIDKHYGPIIIDYFNCLFELTNSYYFRIFAIIIASICALGTVTALLIVLILRELPGIIILGFFKSVFGIRDR